MIKRNFTSYLLLFCLVLTSCAGNNVVTRPAVLVDAESYTNAGLEAYAEANWKSAQLLFTRALSLYQGIDDQQGVLYSHINLAEVALSRRDYSTAKTHLDIAANIAKKDLLQYYQGRVSLLYALNALQQNKTVLAESILEPLLPAFDNATPVTIPDIVQIAAIANRTKIAFVQKQDEQLWTLRYANALKQSTINNPDLEARLLRFQSSLMLRQGNYEKAETKLQQALSNYKSSLTRSGIAATLFELGAMYMIQSNWQEALGYLNRSIAVFRYLEDLEKVVQVTEQLAIVEAELGNLERSHALNKWLVETKNK